MSTEFATRASVCSAAPADDTRLGDRVRSALAEFGCGAPIGVAISVERSEMVLSDSVESFYHKQLAQQTALRLADSFRLVNRLTVRSEISANGKG